MKLLDKILILLKIRKIGYKVIKIYNNKLYSSTFNIDTYNSSGSIEYFVNKYIKNKYKCGPLCLFDDINNAKNTILNTPNKKIYKCVYKKSNEKLIYDKHNNVLLTVLPKGTILASKIKLIKEIII